MAARYPLVRKSGQLTQLPAGDALRLPGPLNDPSTPILTAVDNLDITGVNSTLVRLDASSAVSINGFASSSDGIRRIIKFNSNVITLVYQDGVLNLPGNANILTASGDFAEFVCEGGGSWRCLWYERRNGTALVGTADATKLPLAGGTLTGALNEAMGVLLMSAATVNIGAAATNTVNISGANTITAFDTIASGAIRRVRFTGSLTLTYNSSTMLLPTGANIQTASGDVSEWQSLGSGIWRCLWYLRFDGTALTATPDATKLPLAGGTLSGALNEAPTVTLASASTVNIGAAASNTVAISGTTTITAFDTVADGVTRKVRFTGAMLLTYNATSLILPTSANITTANGDAGVFQSLGSGNWKCLSYNKADGTALVGMTNPMTATGDLIKGGGSGAPGVLAIGSTGQILAVSGGAPTWSSGFGIAPLIASGTDYPFYVGSSSGAFGSATVNSTTRTQFHLVHLDSVLTFDHIVIGIRTLSASQSMDIGIYTFLGAGKPGTCLASANFSTAATGRISVAVTATTLPPGLYYVAWHATSSSPTCVTLNQQSGFYESALAGVSISDAMTQLGAGTTTLAAVLFNDASLPGGAYSRGMNMTGLTLSSGNIVGYNTSVPVVGLTKQ